MVVLQHLFSLYTYICAYTWVYINIYLCICDSIKLFCNKIADMMTFNTYTSAYISQEPRGHFLKCPWNNDQIQEFNIVETLV